MILLALVSTARFYAKNLTIVDMPPGPRLGWRSLIARCFYGKGYERVEFVIGDTPKGPQTSDVVKLQQRPTTRISDPTGFALNICVQ
jgi:hypothetical protein